MYDITDGRGAGQALAEEQDRAIMNNYELLFRKAPELSF